MSFEALSLLDHARKSFNSTINKADRSEYGQFLTPTAIARFMSSLFEVTTPKVRILDPGAGAGVLFASCVEALIFGKHRPLSIEVVVYETDGIVLPYLEETMNWCESLCVSAGVSFHGTVRTEDFISSTIMETEGTLFAVPGGRFTHAILNPPYKKINSRTALSRMLYSAGKEVANLWSRRIMETFSQIALVTPRNQWVPLRQVSLFIRYQTFTRRLYGFQCSYWNPEDKSLQSPPGASAMALILKNSVLHSWV